MKSNKKYNSFLGRILSVWFRHYKVYTKNFISNGFPPFLEPLIMLAGIGLGLDNYVGEMEGLPFLQYLASGLLVSTAMYTATFETTFGTFIRLEFEKAYDGILTAPITADNLLLSEILWTGTKGFFFSFAVLIMVSLFQVIPFTVALPVPIIGFFTGAMFGALGLFVTSFVKNINHFNFFFTGVISPMFFFSGIIFPISNLPQWIQPAAELMPLTHPVRLSRAICGGTFGVEHLFDIGYILLFTAVIGYFGIKRLRNRLID